MVESQPSKLLVAGSIPVSRSSLRSRELSPKRELRLGKPSTRRLSRRRAKREGGHLPLTRNANTLPLAEALRYGCLVGHIGQGHRNGRLVGRSAKGAKADVAQLAERVLGKDEVTSSILVIGSRLRSHE